MISPEQLIQIAHAYGTPTYVYDKNVMVRQYTQLDDHISYTPKKINYACKANSNLSILRVFKDLGCGVDVVSAGELFIALKAGFDPHQILFTGNNLARWEIEFAVSHDILMTLDSLSQLEIYGKINPHSQACIRINPNLGAGHHKHVITGGLQSKFGIYYTEIQDAQRIAARHDLTIVGVHEHIGSGILDPDLMMYGVSCLLDSASHFSHLEFVDIGGGLGISYKAEDTPLDTEVYGQKLSTLFATWVESYGSPLTLVLEPGRFLVAQSGILLTQVTAIKSNPKYTFIGVDTGFNQLMRPILYNAYHEITVVGSHDTALTPVTVCGNICESGDIFAKSRLLPPIQEGDLLAIHDVGAYGFSMASTYNARGLPAEILVDGDQVTLIRKRDEFKDLLYNQVFEVYGHE
jgi:diaminopimelate decarboxylase